MTMDSFVVAALVDELMDTIVGGRVQDSVMVDSTGIGLEIYANHRRQYLYLSVDTQYPRVHLIGEKLRRGTAKPSQLALLIRRYCEGGHILHVSHPPFERILEMSIIGEEGEVTLVIEPMERRSNIILVQNGMILDCARRIGPQENRYRITLPAHQYVAPPPIEGRMNPADLTLESFAHLFEGLLDPELKTTSLLSSNLLGMSGLLAREAVVRAGGSVTQKAQDAHVSALYRVLTEEIFAPLLKREWQPGNYYQKGEIAGFSVLPLVHVERWESTPSLSVAMCAHYGIPGGEDGYRVAKIPVAKMIQEGLAKEGAKLNSMQKSLRDAKDIERLKQSGELIFAYQYAIQAQQTKLVAQYDPDEPAFEIRLDPRLTPTENAEAYFHRYDKAKRAHQEVPALIEDSQHKIAYLHQLETDLDLARNWVEIDEIRQSLHQLGHWNGQVPRKIGGEKTAPLRVVSADGFVMWVGRNSRQNEEVTFKRGSADDLWLHVRGVPGAHVVIKFDGRTIPEAVIQQASSHAAYYSKLRHEASVLVDVTQCKHVKKIKGAAVGMVTYRNETTRSVVPHPVEER